jgi:hypothetical protein
LHVKAQRYKGRLKTPKLALVDGRCVFRTERDSIYYEAREGYLNDQGKWRSRYVCNLQAAPLLDQIEALRNTLDAGLAAEAAAVARDRLARLEYVYRELGNWTPGRRGPGRGRKRGGKNRPTPGPRDEVPGGKCPGATQEDPTCPTD